MPSDDTNPLWFHMVQLPVKIAPQDVPLKIGEIIEACPIAVDDSLEIYDPVTESNALVIITQAKPSHCQSSELSQVASAMMRGQLNWPQTWLTSGHRLVNGYKDPKIPAIFLQYSGGLQEAIPYMPGKSLRDTIIEGASYYSTIRSVALIRRLTPIDGDYGDIRKQYAGKGIHVLHMFEDESYEEYLGHTPGDRGARPRLSQLGDDWKEFEPSQPPELNAADWRKINNPWRIKRHQKLPQAYHDYQRALREGSA